MLLRILFVSLCNQVLCLQVRHFMLIIILTVLFLDSIYLHGVWLTHGVQTPCCSSGGQCMCGTRWGKEWRAGGRNGIIYKLNSSLQKYNENTWQTAEGWGGTVHHIVLFNAGSSMIPPHLHPGPGRDKPKQQGDDSSLGLAKNWALHSIISVHFSCSLATYKIKSNYF